MYSRGHMLIHQNLKPYNCKFCGISFRLLSTVSQHIAVSPFRYEYHVQLNYTDYMI